MQSECHKRVTGSPALTRSKPRESSTAVPETNGHSEPVYLSKKERFHNQSRRKHIRYPLQAKLKYENNNASSHLQTDQEENQSKGNNDVEFDNDLHLPTEILPTTEHEPKENNQKCSQIQSSTLSKDWW